MTNQKTLPHGEAKKIELMDQFGALGAHFAEPDDISVATMSPMEALLRFVDHIEETIDDRFSEMSENVSVPKNLGGGEVPPESLDQFRSPWQNDDTGKWDIADYDFQGAVEYDAQTMQIVSECKVRFLDGDDIESPTAALTVECHAKNEAEQAEPASLLLEDKLLEADNPILPRSLSVARVEGGITQGPNADDPHGSFSSGNNNGVDD